VLPALERRHDVLALTLAGHAGGPPLPDAFDDAVLADAVEEALDAAGLGLVDLVGNSLGGYVALQLAARGRARSVVALAPAGGWAHGDASYRETLRLQLAMYDLLQSIAPQAEAILASPEGRRRATSYTSVRYEHIPSELLAHQMRAAAATPGLRALVAYAQHAGWPLDADRITCPVRVVWGTEDRLLPWPRAAARFRHDWLPHADWVELDGVGHCPQLDVPLVAAELILGWTG
jgi:pimeloyl-ACP methyl ester carboxylesterase